MSSTALRFAVGVQKGLQGIVRRQIPASASYAAHSAALHATYGEKYPYLDPWPYETKPFTVFDELFRDHKSVDRFNENSKVIIVEGNVGSGKNDFAKRLAKIFDLKYFPSINKADLHACNNGLDWTIIDPLLPEVARRYTNEKFLADENPERGTVGRLQLEYFEKRFRQYYKALLHLYSTGQGVVLVRSCFSDIVFKDALRSLNWVTKPFDTYYDKFIRRPFIGIRKPHLSIYLDRPIELCYENIQQRNGEDAGKRNMTLDYLAAIEAKYKKYLPTQKKYQEVVDIDWQVRGDDLDVEAIADELSTISLESPNPDDPKFHEWRDTTQDTLNLYRRMYSFKHDWQMQNLLGTGEPWDCPEVMEDPEVILSRNRVIEDHPALNLNRGYRGPFFGEKSYSLSLFSDPK